MSFKIANTTTDTVFVISVNGGALWEFEPGNLENCRSSYR